jgi:GxxExxY protein
MLIYQNITNKILGVCMDVFHELGSGFLEPVYQEALAIALLDASIPFKREHPLTIYFRGKPLTKTYIADFICNDKIILELKAVKKILPEHKAQLLNYLKATGLPIGYIINFHGDRLTWDRVIAKTEWLHPTNQHIPNSASVSDARP